VVTRRWGDKSRRVERRLMRSTITLRSKRTGRRQKFVRSFSAIAERYGVTRELVRQIAAGLGVRSLYHIKRKEKVV